MHVSVAYLCAADNITAADCMPDEPASVLLDIGTRAAGQHDWHTALEWFQLAAAKLADRPLDWYLDKADNATRAQFISAFARSDERNHLHRTIRLQCCATSQRVARVPSWACICVRLYAHAH